MAIKNALLRKKIDTIMYDLLIQTTGDVVVLSDGVTLNAKVAQIMAALEKIISEEIINGKISASTESLYAKITGFTPDITINEAYDTIKEIAEWLTTETPTSAQDIVDNIAALNEAVQKLEETATKVVKSDINGNIKVDGAEVTVYTHPDTHSASMIDETETRKFVSPEEKEKWNGAETMVHLDGSSADTDYSILDTADSCTISFEDMALAISYQNTAAETVAVADGPTSITSEVGSSKFVQFTLPEGYNITSVINVIDSNETPITFNKSYDNKVTFTVTNIGNLTYSESGVPSYTTNHSVKVVIDPIPAD